MASVAESVASDSQPSSQTGPGRPKKSGPDLPDLQGLLDRPDFPGRPDFVGLLGLPEVRRDGSSIGHRHPDLVRIPLPVAIHGEALVLTDQLEAIR
jgi:hypothetical protein